MVWMLLAGCAAEIEGEGAAGGMDLSEFLDEEVLAGIPERAWIERADAAAIGWGPGAIPVEAREEWGIPGLFLAGIARRGVPVFAIEDRALGAVIPMGEVRLLVTLPRSTLRTVLVEETLAVPDPDRFDPDDPRAPGLLLPAGTALDLDEAEGAFIPVHGAWGFLRADAWAPVEGVDHFARVERGSLYSSGDLTLDSATALLDAPGGQPFAWLEQESGARRVGPAIDGFVLVEVELPEIKARGYVQAPDEEALTLWGGGWGEGGQHSVFCGYSAYFGAENLLPAGTRLHLSPGGPVVGEVLREIDAPVMDREEGWEAVEIDTVWGPVDLWVAP